jgi:polysaccharide pyruvyl transferase WcaK-like protein
VRVLVEPNAHHLLNMGDVAMLTVTVERLQVLWPDATVGVLTDSPELLAVHCPEAVPVPAAGHQLWFDLPYIGEAVRRRLPADIARWMRNCEQKLRRRRPNVAASIIRARRRLKRLDAAELDEFLGWLFGADAVAVVGAGLLTDAFAPSAVTVLELVETAVERGAPAAMFGQGVGPLTDPTLQAWCRRVLPRLDLIALREQRAGLPLLLALGVDSSKIMTTGDDALELALRTSRPEAMGGGIGVSLRRARYSEIGDEVLSQVGSLLRRAARDRGAPIVPVPISRYPKERDAHVIARALGLTDVEEATSPHTALAAVQRCRVVVTGSYHAGVFALARGVPVVGLAQSGYYVDKFLGLSDQFGGVCRVVRLDAQDYEDVLEDAVAELWDRADQLRPQLIAAAKEQVERSWAAYRKFQALVESKVSGARGVVPKAA